VSSGSSTSGAGGYLGLYSGNGSTSGGKINISGGKGGLNGGPLQLSGGATKSTNPGGDVTIESGEGITTSSGSIALKTSENGISGVSEFCEASRIYSTLPIDISIDMILSVIDSTGIQVSRDVCILFEKVSFE